MLKYIKPKQYAKNRGIDYRTAIKHFYAGTIEGYREPTGAIFLKNPDYIEKQEQQAKNRVVLYARVSSTTNKASLDGQLDRMRQFAIAKGYTIVREEKEIASGLNDNRRKLNSILSSNDWDILLVEHKDRLTRFGFNYFSILEKSGQRVEVINHVDNKDEDLMNDFISAITSFCGRIYGANRKGKTNKIIEEVKNINEK